MGSRRARAFGLLAALSGVVLLLLAGALPPAGAAAAATPRDRTAATASGGGSATVLGPHVWQPATGTYGPQGSVTVSPATSLTDQVVHVTWSGFTPSVNLSTGGPAQFEPVGSATVAYGVRIYECRGDQPQPTDCYGSTVYNAVGSKGFQQPPPPAGSTTPEFPSNMALAVTRADGTGEADIEVWTAHESQSLGCDAHHACSLVIEANYGGDPLGFAPALGVGAQSCENHTWDTNSNNVTNASATDAIISGQDFAVGNQDGEQCAWNHHVVVPLQFAQTAADCRAGASDFAVRGLEMANRMMQSWRSGFCLGSDPLFVQYTASGGEPQARQAFLNRLPGSDLALTAYPDTSPAPRPYVYAPLATSGIVVTFAADDRNTGAPITTMRLDARLLAKQLTQSYVGQQDPSTYDSTKGNPACLYADPEFLQLNPEGTNGPHWPACSSANAGGALPIVVGGTTDLVEQLTSWIAADPDAASFLAGNPDPWQMHVDTHYLKPGFAGYPVNVFVPQDSSNGNGTGIVPSKSYEWNPLLGGLIQVGRNMLSAQPTALDWSPDPSGNHAKFPPETAGNRSVMAVMDAGQAAAFALPEAQLLNPAGAYVGPGDASFGAAVRDMATDPSTGTAMLPYTSASSTGFAADKSAYPLTTVQYAMLPTQGVSAAKVAKIVGFLHRAASGGQQPGFGPGQLAAGFLPLTATQRAALTRAICDVQRQDSQKPGDQSSASPCSSPSGGGSGGGSGGLGGASGGTAGGTTGGATTGGTSAGTTAGATTGGTSGGAKVKPQALSKTQPVAAGAPEPDRVGGQRLLLPILLIAGGVLLVGGPTTLVLTGTDAGVRLRRGGRRAWRRARGLVTRHG